MIDQLWSQQQAKLMGIMEIAVVPKLHLLTIDDPGAMGRVGLKMCVEQ